MSNNITESGTSQELREEQHREPITKTTGNDTESVTTNAVDTVSELDSNNTSNLRSLMEQEIAKRYEQERVWGLAGNPKALETYKKIIGDVNELKGVELKHHLTEQIHRGNINDQGKFIGVPADFHKGPFMFDEDSYSFIYGELTDQKIKGNCNSELMEQINGTEVTKGMMKVAEGHVWNNGMIAYNKNNIVIRGKDNEYGQPGGNIANGFVQGIFFYDRLGVEVMKQYIVPKLIRNANEGLYDSKTDPESVRKEIVSIHKNVYNEKLKMLNTPDIIKPELFVDAPSQETLNKPLDPKDRRIDNLEKKVKSLESKLKQTLKKMIDMEDIVLDISIKLESLDKLE